MTIGNADTQGHVDVNGLCYLLPPKAIMLSVVHATVESCVDICSLYCHWRASLKPVLCADSEGHVGI